MLRELKKLIKRLKGKSRTDYMATQAPSMGQSNPVIVNTWMASSALSTGTSAIPYINDMGAGQVAQMAADPPKPTDARIEKKPVEVVAEILQKDKPAISVNDLDKQIKMVEDRLKVLKHFKGQTGDETKALRYLYARRYFKKYEKLFPWATTTSELIDDLVRRYKLQRVGFGGYSKSVPMEATLELEKFGKAWEKVVDDDEWEPQLLLITDYMGPEHKKDPILLASSPFGQWFYVLGAWDKEVEIVDEIVYRNK